MDEDDVIEISSGESDHEPGYTERRAILEPAIRSVVEALGGYEGKKYRMGDEAYGCLKDLKKYWRKDDTDDERTVARIFWATRVLTNDLVPILLETAGKGHVEDKRAIACADLITAMTWPIDLAEELKELDDEVDRGTDYTLLVQSHLYYKAALLRPGVMPALFNIMLPCLAKDVKERKEKDVQIINVILHLVRNLAFIKDLPANIHLSSDQINFSSLQSQFIRVLSEANYLELLLTIASNATTEAMFNGWNTLVLEIFYLLFRGVKPSSLVLDQAKQTTRNLHDLLSIEGQRRRNFARYAPSRHSRFGTTISVKLNPQKNADPSKGDKAPDAPAAPPEPPASQALILHRQQGLKKEAGTILDLLKRQKTQKGKKVDELGREDNLSIEARTALQNLARSFIESAFNPFLASLLKDIKSERPKITEKDNLRLLFVTKWFLEFFLAVRSKEKNVGSGTSPEGGPWGFGLVGEVVERGWIVWVLKRMNGAIEEKPKLWTEWQAGIECLTQLLALIEAMSGSQSLAAGEDGTELRDAAETLQQQLIYNGQILDAALDGLRSYKDGTQSLAFLDASVHLAYNLIKMLERWGKTRGEGAYVRKRAKPRRKRRARGAAAGEQDGDEEEAEEVQAEKEEVVEETMFTFDAFLQKFANADITHTLLTYLSRYREFPSQESMKRVVGLMYRQAVHAKAEGLYFQVSTLDLFKVILADQSSLPKDQTSKDLIQLIKYILRQFFKAVEADSFVLIEAFFPKNRGQWKKLSSWEPEKKSGRAGGPDDARFPPDVQVKKGYTWSEQLAITVAALHDAGQDELVEWVKDILKLVIEQRQQIIEETDGVSRTTETAADAADLDDDELKAALQAKGPSNEALGKITDYLIPYISDEQAEAATKNPQLKLLFRLVKCYIQDEDADELEWYIPAGILLADLQRSLSVITQFQAAPLDLGDERPAQLLSKTRRRRRRRARADSDSENDAAESDAAPRKRERKRREKEQYKSAQFVEDSDAEYGADIDAFFARERALREKTALAAADSALGIGTMRATGTKKRRRKAAGGQGTKRRRKGAAAGESSADEGEGAVGAQGLSDSDGGGDPRMSRSPQAETVQKPRPRPRPRPKLRTQAKAVGDSDASDGAVLGPAKRSSPEQEAADVPASGGPAALESDSNSDAVRARRSRPTRPPAIVTSDEE